MRKVLAKNPQVEQRKLHRRVFLENIDPENQALMVEIPFLFIGLYNIYELINSNIFLSSPFLQFLFWKAFLRFLLMLLVAYFLE